MVQSAKDEILGRLRAAPKETLPPRPYLPPLSELSLGKDELISKFTEILTGETGVVHRVKNNREALDKLTQVVKEEKLKCVMATTDSVIAPLNLPGWGKEQAVNVLTPKDFADRDSFKDAVFDQVQAGITGADYAFAESGTLAVIHNKDQARLVSLAPILHIAILPSDRIVSVYEPIIEKVFSNKDELPSQFVFISGPSMTADIQGHLFKGMHGPRKVIVILIG
jgi:L-lactate dehydrogenase complex protein LldG